MRRVVQRISSFKEHYPFLLPHCQQATAHTIKISEAYFETIHLQYPFLHQPSHMKLIEHVYAEPEPSAIAAFQVYLVLAIGATVLSPRLKIPLSLAKDFVRVP